MKKSTFKKKAKDPGIPNSLPFKEKILQDIQEHKQKAEEYRKAIKENLKKEKAKEIAAKKANKPSNLNEYVKQTEQRNKEFEDQQEPMEGDQDVVLEKETSNLKAFHKEFQKVFDSADFIIEVLDARDPLGTRCHEVEQLAQKNPNKRIILLLNKSDLVPKDNLAKWVKYLRNEFITVPFKSSTQSQKHNLARSNVNILAAEEELLKTNKCFGADFLMKLLNKYCHNKNIKTAITVGVVGFPNVGKSSVINSLKRASVCTVGSMPGLTKSMQSINLDKHIKLLDCPGVIFAKNSLDKDNQQSSSVLALRNVIKIESLADPVLPIEALLNRVRRDDLMTFYRLTEFTTVREFLTLVAKRFGKLLKGGIYDINSAAKKVLQDWNSGKIKYFTLPPENVSSTIDTTIVTQMSKEFDIQNDFAYDEFINTMETEDDSVATAFQFNTDIADDQMGQSSSTQISLPVVGGKRKVESIGDVEMEDLQGMQINKGKKAVFKKNKKLKKRNEKLSNKLDSIKLSESIDFE